MADFRKKLFGLAAAVTMFTGAAYGQLCNGGTTTLAPPAASGATFVRSEGQTELLPPLTFTCTQGAANAANAATATLTVYLGSSIPVTSKVLNTSSGQTEAVATLNGYAVFGTIVGSSITFTNLPFPAVAAAGSTVITISNIRVNASSQPAQVAGSLPQAITAQAFISGPITNLGTGTVQTVTPSVSNSATVAYSVSGFGTNTGKLYKDTGNNSGGTNIPGGSTYAVCTSLNNSSTVASATNSFYVAVNEGFSAAFKTINNEASTVLIPANVVSPIAPASYTGAYPTLTFTLPITYTPPGGTATTVPAVTSATNQVNSGTRIKLVFANIPTGVSIFTSQLVGSVTLNGTAAPAYPNTDGAILTAVASETGASTPGTPPGIAGLPAATSPAGLTGLTAFTGTVNGPGSLVAATVSGTTATVIYELTTDNVNVIDSFSIPVYYVISSNTVLPTTTAISVTTSLAPQPATAASLVPSFTSTAPSYITSNTISFASCTTTLLFPFVTNAGGFETGIAIANTSADPFKGKNGGATPQSGICTLNYYSANTAGGGTNPAAVTAPLGDGAGGTYQAGEVYAFTLTQSLAVNTSNPATFQGYIIAQCGFNYAHAFAYILGGLQPGMFVNPTNTAMGYLAIVLNRGAISGTTDSNGF